VAAEKPESEIWEDCLALLADVPLAEVEKYRFTEREKLGRGGLESPLAVVAEGR
jgi:hypothetical protein